MILGFAGGCTGVFFHPSQHYLFTPDQLDLAYEKLLLETPDGEQLHNWWIPAKTPRARGTVYYLHGNAQNIGAHLLNVAWLPKAGYNLLLLDYRGYGHSTGEPTVDGVLKDVRTGLGWVRGREDAGPLYVLGQSLGGSLAILALAEEAADSGQALGVEGLIVDAAFTGFRRIAREKLASFWLTWPLQYPLSLTIEGDRAPVEALPGLEAIPLMIIHSRRDPVVPYRHGLELREAAAGPVAFLPTRTPHGATFLVPAYRRELLHFMEDPLAYTQGEEPEARPAPEPRTIRAKAPQLEPAP